MRFCSSIHRIVSRKRAISIHMMCRSTSSLRSPVEADILELSNRVANIITVHDPETLTKYNLDWTVSNWFFWCFIKKLYVFHSWPILFFMVSIHRLVQIFLCRVFHLGSL